MKTIPFPLMALCLITSVTAKDVTTIYREQAARNAALHAEQTNRETKARLDYLEARRRMEERERQKERQQEEGDRILDEITQARKEREIEERVQREVARRLALEKQAAAQESLPPLSEQIKTWSAGAENGDAQSQVNMAWCYYDGTGVLKDDRKALMWFTLAAEATNHPDLRKIVNQLDVSMPLARVNEAREMIRIWKKAHK